ncbi:hypothetical protein [Nocardia xishanensis]|uniref:hypothetical protein n=1 Tax=Nocardia xishanensis TaxID=238964 RepID=UPI000836665B|nr:hypothetical protein [Nocardia xishanensis]
MLFEILRRHADPRAAHIGRIADRDAFPVGTVLNSVTFWHGDGCDYGPDQISNTLTVAGSEGLISNEVRSDGSRKRRLDYRILTSIIAFGLAMIFLVLAFIVMARAVAPTSDRGRGEVELDKHAALTPTH